MLHQFSQTLSLKINSMLSKHLFDKKAEDVLGIMDMTGKVMMSKTYQYLIVS